MTVVKTRAGRRRPGRAALAGAASVAVALVFSGCGVDDDDGRPGSGPSRVTSTFEPPAPTVTAPQSEGGDAQLVTIAPDPAAAPLRVRIPALGVDAPIVALAARQADDLVAVLPPSEVGWFSGTAPGTVGVATLAAHTGSSGAFRRLAELEAGSEVVVVDTSGAEHRFVAQSSATYLKGTLPKVGWGPARTPMLALVSCTGPRRADGLHRDNLVLWAGSAP